MAVIVPADIKKTVAFLFSSDNPPQPLGTGFWVAVPAESDSEFRWCYIVTARHVIEGWREVNVRMNLQSETQASTMRLTKVSLVGRPVLFHSNPAVDIALIPFDPAELGDADFKVIVEDMFATRSFREEQEVAEGDEVFFVGMMPQFYGKLTNLPVVRYGRIALLTDEALMSEEGRAHHIYIEANSYKGNSGSPVFLRLGPMRRAGVTIRNLDLIVLLGVMEGYFPQPGEIDIVTAEAKEDLMVFLENINIALVSPVDYLAEILESPEAKKIRVTS